MMLRKSIFGMVSVALLVVLVTIGINKYIESTTTIEYGQLPEDNIPKRYEEVTYTIPTVDEDGAENSQTFTIKNGEKKKPIVKLSIRNSKVQSYEFIGKQDVPVQVMKRISKRMF